MLSPTCKQKAHNYLHGIHHNCCLPEPWVSEAILGFPVGSVVKREVFTNTGCEKTRRPSILLSIVVPWKGGAAVTRIRKTSHENKAVCGSTKSGDAMDFTDITGTREKDMMTYITYTESMLYFICTILYEATHSVIKDYQYHHHHNHYLQSLSVHLLPWRSPVFVLMFLCSSLFSVKVHISHLQLCSERLAHNLSR